MKHFFRTSLLLVAMSLACVSCEQGRDVIEETEYLYVTIAGQTKVQMDSDLKTFWNEGDEVSVFRGTSSNDCWSYTGKTGETKGTLVKKSEGASSFDAGKTIIIYPYLADNSLSEDGVLSTTVDASQSYVADSYAIGANRMVASGTGDSYVLKNLCCFVNLQFTGNSVIKSITLRGNDSEHLSGSATVDVQSLSLKVDGTGTDVVLDCGEGVQLSLTGPTSFIFALAPQTFSKGVTAVVKFADGKEETKTTDKSIALERNVVVTLSGAQEVTSLNVSSFENPEQGDVYYW